ncbi:ELMO domain-containing C-like [Micractinium conductrix]|uniref:ELMO domain-containing C-like n=1 Tax=Micractinium conductrix TaxID=554055 RepID=A0A2P6VKS9_9CHLO|nr:ELMO domain-containing C-like [Micractinium conductrix]|eukprot:PSC74667.1 ELMO domain-containing C-like [Micractinium conductrix]
MWRPPDQLRRAGDTPTSGSCPGRWRRWCTPPSQSGALSSACCTACCRQAAASCRCLQEERVAALQRRARVTFDDELPQHQAALRELWGAAFPGAPFPPGVRHEQWKQLGFQSDVPARDLSRGAGMLTLECLVWMAQERPATFHALSRKTAGVRAEWEYPFAAGGANVAFMLAELLGLRGGVGAVSASSPAGPAASPAARGFLPLLDPLLPGSGEGRSVGCVAVGGGGAACDGGGSGGDSCRQFEELFELTFRLLDQVWLERKAGYMQFPAVMSEVRERVERALASGRAASVADMEQMLLPAA